MDKKQKRDYIIKGLQSKGWTREQAIGLTANFEAESGFRSEVEGDKHLSSSSFGLAQWRGNRLNNLKNMYGSNWKNLDNQIDFVDWELREGTHKHVGNKLKNIHDVATATTLITTDYEVPADRFNKAKQRVKIAQGYTDIKDVNFGSSDTQEVAQIKPSIQFNMLGQEGQLYTPPETKEERSNEAKTEILQKQVLEKMIAQVPKQEQVEYTPEAPTYEYLSNTNLFTLQ